MRVRHCLPYVAAPVTLKTTLHEGQALSLICSCSCDVRATLHEGQTLSLTCSCSCDVEGYSTCGSDVVSHM